MRFGFVSWQCTLSKLTISRTKRHVGVKLILISGEQVTWAELRFVIGGEIDAQHRQFRGKSNINPSCNDSLVIVNMMFKD